MAELLLKKWTRMCLVSLAFFLLTAAILPESVFAGKGTFRKTGPDTGVFDFCVSVRFNATEAQLLNIRQVFETASRILADATDGQHQFGNISIVNNDTANNIGAGDEAEFWIFDKNGVTVSAQGKYGYRGAHVNLFYGNDFSNPGYIYKNGVTIVHEFAHLAYDLGDEYYGEQLPPAQQPLNSGIHCRTREQDSINSNVNFCVMDTFKAATSEFCVASNHDKPDPDGQRGFDTAQSLMHNGDSCWDTMFKLEKPWRLKLPTGLPQDAPPPTQPVTFGTSCAARTQKVVILIDRSGSMATRFGTVSRLDMAKRGVNNFINEFVQFSLGHYFGIVSFSTIASVDFPLTQINDSTAKNNAMAAVESQFATGATNIGSGLQTALAQITSQGECTGCEKTIILLSDGDHNIGLPPASVIVDIQKAGVNVVAVTVGNDISSAGEKTLKDIANQTQGTYYRALAPTDYVAFLRILARGFTGYKPVLDAPQIINSGQVKEIPVRVETGATNTSFGVITADQMDNLTLSLRKPSGGMLTETNGQNVEFSADPNMRLFKITAPEAGIWTIVVSAGVIRTGDINAFADTKHDGTDLLAWIDKDTVFSTETVKVEATPMYEGRSIIGSSVTGTVIRPDGSQLPITLFDDGSDSSGDITAKDGVYTALFNDYNSDGTYTFKLKYENVNGKMYAGEPFPDENGVVQVYPQPDVPPSTRLTSVTAIVSGLTTGDTVWVDDSLPRGATPSGDWYWVDSNPAAIMGGVSHQSKITGHSGPPYPEANYGHSFEGATAKLPINVGDKLFTYVFLDPNNVPNEIMLQWNDGTWEHRAYWGADNISSEGPARSFMGALPPSGQWVRLEVPASWVGLEGKTLNGMAFRVEGGRATWDRSGKTTQLAPAQPTTAPGSTIFFEDALPAGAIPAVQDDHWEWVSTSPAPISGLYHRSFLADKTAAGRFRAHSFSGVQVPMVINPGDILFTYAYLDPTYTPDEIMLQWNDGDGWEHRAFWGNNFVDIGTTGTESRRFMGGLPPAGQWVRLEVPASYVGLEGKAISGMSFGYYKQNDRARVSWDQSGKSADALTVPLALSATTPLYRLFGTDSGGYYYYSTNDIGRADQGVQRIQCNIFANQAAGTVPLYRFRNSAKRYFYGLDRNGPSPSIWTYEAIAGYVYPPHDPVVGTVPLYRFRGQYDYFYSTDMSEGSGMTYDGIACYVNQAQPLATLAAPTNLTLSMPDATGYLIWNDNSDNETGFKIERASETHRGNPFNWVEVARVGANVTGFKLEYILSGQFYRVRATNDFGNSAYSNAILTHHNFIVNDSSEPALAVNITSPVNNDILGTDVTIKANAFDINGGGTIRKVEFFEGSTKLGEAMVAPYNFYWANVPAGSHTLTAKATDNAGATASSPPVSFIANNKPVVSLSGPADGTIFSAPANISITASASDSDGTISKVEFFQGATKLGEDSTAPYEVTWDAVDAGSYTLTAVATDNNGVTTTSSAINITVNNSPTVNITTPANDTVINLRESISISADAADADGLISKVEFFQGATKLGEDSTAPYEYVWSNVASGSYSLTAKATDNQGTVTTSPVVNITVFTNVALAANGGIATASSTTPTSDGIGNYQPIAAINDERRGFGTGDSYSDNTFWRDGTQDVYPDWLQVDFNGPKLINEIDVYSLQDDYHNPVEPTESTTFSLYGITAFDVQYWNGADWIIVPDGRVTGNNKVWRKFTFPSLNTNKIRVSIKNALANRSRIVELEAYGMRVCPNSATSTFNASAYTVAPGTPVTINWNIPQATGISISSSRYRPHSWDGQFWFSEQILNGGGESGSIEIYPQESQTYILNAENVPVGCAEVSMTRVINVTVNPVPEPNGCSIGSLFGTGQYSDPQPPGDYFEPPPPHTLLYWNVPNATSITITDTASGSYGTYSGSVGEIPITPTSSMTYILSAVTNRASPCSQFTMSTTWTGGTGGGDPWAKAIIQNDSVQWHQLLSQQVPLMDSLLKSAIGNVASNRIERRK
jgi:uncharacterized protein YegL